MRKQLTIASREVFRSGVTNGKAWELCNVTDTEKNYYSTFAALQIGQTYDCEIVEEKSAKINPKTNQPYVNKKITKVYGADFSGEKTEKEKNKLGELEDRIKNLEDYTGINQ